MLGGVAKLFRGRANEEGSDRRSEHGSQRGSSIASAISIIRPANSLSLSLASMARRPLLVDS